MKYIRTKDGRIIDNEIMCIRFAPDNIFKQADTIEELCDKFVVINNTTNKIASICETVRADDWKWRKDTYTIYSAILTNKGIIYVAKMNKGEFELL